MSTLFEESLTVLSSHLHGCVLEADESVKLLDVLEDQLDSIRTLTTSENGHLISARSKMLKSFWHTLGGYRATIEIYENDLAILYNVETYIKRALQRVKLTPQVLTEMENKIEALKTQADIAQRLIGKAPLALQFEDMQRG